MAKDSFLSCAITISITLDGSDDGKSHCLKPGQMCAAGRALLAKETAKATEETDDCDSDGDPFASDKDEEKNLFKEPPLMMVSIQTKMGFLLMKTRCSSAYIHVLQETVL